MEATKLALQGNRLTSQEAEELERQIKSQPTNITSRTKLLGYYFLRSHDSSDNKSKREQHILWLIRNSPEASILDSPYGYLISGSDGYAYVEGRQAWLEQTKRQAQNPIILSHAANYLLLNHRAEAANLFKQAEAVEPNNPRWAHRLGHLYAIGLSDKQGVERQKAAQQGLEAMERSFYLTQRELSRFALLADLANLSFESGAADKAQEYADNLLKQAEQTNPRHWNYGNAIHHGNLTLGRIALRKGNLEKAKAHLLAAGHTPGSPHLNSSGPNMMLAQELLERGERQVVLDYFQLCGQFWKRSKLDKWTTEVQAGKIPEFGANLDY